MEDSDKHSASTDSVKDSDPKTIPLCDDILGTRWAFHRLTKYDWAFLIISTINLFATIALTTYSIVNFCSDSKSPNCIYSILLLINAIFCLFYVYNGVLRELTFEVITFAGSIILVIVYVIFDYSINYRGRNLFKLLRLIFSCVFAPLNLFLAFITARKFGWLQFQVAGATASQQALYRRRQAFSSLLKFDFQAVVSFFIITLDRGCSLFLHDTIVTAVVGIFISFVWLISIFLVIKFYEIIKRHKGLDKTMLLLGLIGLVEPGLILVKIVYVYYQMVHDHDERDIGDLILYPLLIIGAVAFTVRFILLMELELLYKKFNTVDQMTPNDIPDQNA